MKLEQLKELIDGTIIEVTNDNDAYLMIARNGGECSISFEGKREVLSTCLFIHMMKNRDFADVVLAAAEAYYNEGENGF